jgi:hypothetical protein
MGEVDQRGNQAALMTARLGCVGLLFVRARSSPYSCAIIFLKRVLICIVSCRLVSVCFFFQSSPVSDCCRWGLSRCTAPAFAFSDANCIGLFVLPDLDPARSRLQPFSSLRHTNQNIRLKISRLNYLSEALVHVRSAFVVDAHLTGYLAVKITFWSALAHLDVAEYDTARRNANDSTPTLKRQLLRVRVEAQQSSVRRKANFSREPQEPKVYGPLRELKSCRPPGGCYHWELFRPKSPEANNGFLWLVNHRQISYNMSCHSWASWPRSVCIKPFNM